MEPITYLIIGVCLAIPILFFTSGKQTKDKEHSNNTIQVGYARKLNDKFGALLELSYNKEIEEYNKLYNELSENEKGIFKLYMESKLGKDIDKDRVIDSSEIAQKEACRWFFTLLVESVVVVTVAYLLYRYLKGQKE